MLVTIIGYLSTAFSFVKGIFGFMDKSEARRAAKAEGENEWLRKTLQEVDKSNEADRNLDLDPRYLKWLRNKYKRKD